MTCYHCGASGALFGDPPMCWAHHERRVFLSKQESTCKDMASRFRANRGINNAKMPETVAGCTCNGTDYYCKKCVEYLNKRDGRDG